METITNDKFENLTKAPKINKRSYSTFTFQKGNHNVKNTFILCHSRLMNYLIFIIKTEFVLFYF